MQSCRRAGTGAAAVHQHQQLGVAALRGRRIAGFQRADDVQNAVGDRRVQPRQLRRAGGGKALRLLQNIDFFIQLADALLHRRVARLAVHGGHVLPARDLFPVLRNIGADPAGGGVNRRLLPKNVRRDVGLRLDVSLHRVFHLDKIAHVERKLQPDVCDDQQPRDGGTELLEKIPSRIRPPLVPGAAGRQSGLLFHPGSPLSSIITCDRRAVKRFLTIFTDVSQLPSPISRNRPAGMRAK